MTRKGGIGRYLFKWLFVPIALAALGFFFIGPRIGRSESDDASKVAPTTEVRDPVETGSETARRGEPDVEVSATRVKGRRRSSPQPRTEGEGTASGSNEAPPAADQGAQTDPSHSEESPRISGGG